MQQSWYLGFTMLYPLSFNTSFSRPIFSQSWQRSKLQWTDRPLAPNDASSGDAYAQCPQVPSVEDYIGLTTMINQEMEDPSATKFCGTQLPSTSNIQHWQAQNHPNLLVKNMSRYNQHDHQILWKIVLFIDFNHFPWCLNCHSAPNSRNDVELPKTRAKKFSSPVLG